MSPMQQSWHIMLPKSHGTQSSFSPDPPNLSHMQQSRSLLLGPSKYLISANIHCRHLSPWKCIVNSGVSYTAVMVHDSTKMHKMQFFLYLPDLPNLKHINQCCFTSPHSSFLHSSTACPFYSSTNVTGKEH